MKHEITAAGNLKISLESSADISWLKDLLESDKGNDDIHALCELLEHTGWTPNGKLYRVAPEHIGALTDAPILSDEVEHLDSGEVSVPGNVWWFPNYMLKHFGQVLLHDGHVLFKAAPIHQTS